MVAKHPAVINLNGGLKHNWLQVHRAEVLAYLEAHGELAARERFNIRKTTWDSFIKPKVRQHKPFTTADKAIDKAEITAEGLREVRREVKELKEQYGQFVPLLAEQLTQKFFKPLLAGKIELPPELEYREPEDPLKLADFAERSEK